MRDYGDSVNSIWDGKEDCEHEYGDIIPYAKKDERTPEEKRSQGSIVGNNINSENFAKGNSGSFCSKCNAWKGQLGLEPTFELYINHLCSVFDEVKRVLKKSGTCWVNIGDTYIGGGGGGSKYGGQFNSQEKNTNPANFLNRYKNYPHKCMALIPERFAIEMVNHGWILRNKIVWYKRNSMPSSVKDRFSNKWEHIFFFVKNKKYFFDLDSVRKPYLEASVNRINAGFSEKVHFNYRVREAAKGTLAAKFGDKYKATEKEISEYGNKTIKTKHNNLSLEQAEALGSPRAREVRYNSKGEIYSSINDRKAEQRANGVPHDLANTNPLGGNPGDAIFIDSEEGDFWNITTQPHPFAHFACYPERLCEIPIKAGCPENGIVLDPFIGSGTTSLVSKRLGRNYIGFELNPSYIEIAKKRLNEIEIPLIKWQEIQISEA